MTATFYVGDALKVLATLPEKSVDLVLTSPPFLALRSYLPADHPDKALEGGSQPTPGAYIDWLLDVVEACDRVLAPHGSICIELGDTYAGGSGGNESGWERDKGDYRRENRSQASADGLLQGKPKTRQVPQYRVFDKRGVLYDDATPPQVTPANGGYGWPLPKSLSLIPESFRFAMVYGFNPFTGRQTERWRLRNVIRWVRPNPPVGALGDKFRPATSELMVFCKSANRFFDLDAVRTPHASEKDAARTYTKKLTGHLDKRETITLLGGNPAGAPPLDWWEISLLDDEAKPYGPKERDRSKEPGGPSLKKPDQPRVGGMSPQNPAGAPPLDWWNIPPGGYVSFPEAVSPGEFSGGILYIASEGCSLHEGHPDLTATGPHGGRVEIRSPRNPDTDGRHVQGQLLDSAPIDQPTEPNPEDGSSDSPRPESPPVAKRRSKASSKTAPAPATSSPDNASDRTLGRTGDTSSEPLSVEPHPDNPENRSGEVGLVALALETYARTGHKPAELEGCSCSFYVQSDSTSHYAVKPEKRITSKAPSGISKGSTQGERQTWRTEGGAPPLDWWEIAPGGFSGAHYAVWPPELLIKPIKAMCPEQVCRTCGEARRRIVEPDAAYAARPNAGRSIYPVGSTHGWDAPNEYRPGTDPSRKGAVYHTLGFTDCGHNDYRPGLVLDPFVGSGTTLAVATGHGRDSIGIDLDERNFELALERVGPLVLQKGNAQPVGLEGL